MRNTFSLDIPDNRPSVIKENKIELEYCSKCQQHLPETDKLTIHLKTCNVQSALNSLAVSPFSRRRGSNANSQQEAVKNLKGKCASQIYTILSEEEEENDQEQEEATVKETEEESEMETESENDDETELEYENNDEKEIHNHKEVREKDDFYTNTNKRRSRTKSKLDRNSDENMSLSSSSDELDLIRRKSACFFYQTYKSVDNILPVTPEISIITTRSSSRLSSRSSSSSDKVPLSSAALYKRKLSEASSMVSDIKFDSSPEEEDEKVDCVDTLKVQSKSIRHNTRKKYKLNDLLTPCSMAFRANLVPLEEQDEPIGFRTRSSRVKGTIIEPVDNKEDKEKGEMISIRIPPEAILNKKQECIEDNEKTKIPIVNKNQTPIRETVEMSSSKRSNVNRKQEQTSEVIDSKTPEEPTVNKRRKRASKKVTEDIQLENKKAHVAKKEECVSLGKRKKVKASEITQDISVVEKKKKTRKIEEVQDVPREKKKKVQGIGNKKDTPVEKKIKRSIIPKKRDSIIITISNKTKIYPLLSSLIHTKTQSGESKNESPTDYEPYTSLTFDDIKVGTQIQPDDLVVTDTVLGEGQVGTVNLAKYQGLLVACKSKRNRTRVEPFYYQIQRELKYAADLSLCRYVNKYIGWIYCPRNQIERGLTDSKSLKLYVIQKYIANGDARRYLDGRESVFLAHEALQAAICLFSALTDAHALGIGIVDLKLENFLIDSSGAGWLTDFGSCIEFYGRELVDLDDEEVAWTTNVAAPEMINSHQFSMASDVFMATLIVAELLTVDLSDDEFYKKVLRRHKSNGSVKFSSSLIHRRYNPFVPLLKSGLASNADDRPAARDMLNSLIALRRKADMEEIELMKRR